MDDEKQKDERWRQLAELLGLPPEEARPRSETPAVAQPQLTPAPPPPAPPSPPKYAPEISSPPPPLTETHDPYIETVVVDEFEEFAPDEIDSAEMTPVETDIAPSGEDAAGPEVAENAGAEGDEDKPRRGRRRRRRGRRRGGADRPEGAEPQKTDPHKPAAAPAAPAARPVRPAEEQPASRPAREPQRDSRDRPPPRDSRDRPPQRGNRPGRDERIPLHARNDAEDNWEHDEHPVDEVPEVEYSSPARDDDDDETDILSDWDAPSWEELIASLHRPDR